MNEISNAFSVKNAIKILLLLFSTLALFFIVFSIINAAFFKTPPTLLFGILSFAAYGIIVAVTYFFAKQGTLYPWQALGIRKVSGNKTFLSVIAGIASILAVSFLYSLLLRILKIPEPNLEKAITQMYGTSLLGISITFVLVVVIAPFAEELLFRGYLYPSFRNNWGIGWAIVVTSFLFALAHLSVLIFLPIYFFIGSVLAYVREKNNSVIPSMLLHSLNNFLFFLALINMIK